MCRIVLDCGTTFEFVARGSFGTVFRCGPVFMKLHADPDEGNAENAWIAKFSYAKVPHSLVPATLPRGVIGSLNQIFPHKMTFTVNAGRTLRHLRDSHAHINPVNIVVQVLDFIYALGSKFNVSHCDLHADNILIDGSGKVTVCDYHLVEQIGTVISEKQTVAHYPPEYLTNPYTITQEGDLWMIGKLFETMGGATFDDDRTRDCLLLCSLDPAERLDPARRLLAGKRIRSCSSDEREMQDNHPSLPAVKIESN